MSLSWFDGALHEILLTLFGAAVLFVVQTIYRKWRLVQKRRLLKREIAEYKNQQLAIDVVDLATGDPEFQKQNILCHERSVVGEKCCFYIDMPDELKRRVKERELASSYTQDQLTEFHEDRSFDGSGRFEDLANATGIENLSQLIDEHREIVGEQFVRGANGLIFNGGKYGVFDMRVTRFGEREDPGVEMTLFQTDYFTHRVMRSVYHQLKAEQHPIARADASNFLDYRPFLTSFGVNAVLICEGVAGKEVVFARRSSRVHGTRSRFHVTMNEGLSQTDHDAYGKVDVQTCFQRGLLEELGVTAGQYQEGTKAAFYDFFLERANFEIGLSAVFQIDKSFDKYIERLTARDKQLEVDEFHSVPMKRSKLKDFMSAHEFVPHGEYVLQRVLLREGITI